jgi:hypothetical protein
MKCLALGIAIAALLAPVAGWSADSPSLQGQVLFIPRVDTPEQVGLYQNGTLRRNADGTWSLISVQALEEGNLSNVLNVGKVIVHATESVPTAVYLKVSGAEGRCGFTGIGKVHQRRPGSNFEVNISTSLTPGVHACPAVMAPYQFIEPLDVYGLPMGTYTFNVNGVRGMFTLQQTNKFDDDCSSLLCPLP